MSRPGELDETVSSDEGRSPAAASDPAALPTTLGRFSIESKLGEGGMGIVMRATDPMLGRKVALKVLHHANAGNDADRRQRFLREARAMATLSHENVIVVHEVGTHEGRDYVAMEYVAGTTLGRWQRGRRWAEVLPVYLRAGRGLAAAHRAGLVHRDFKPDNVLIGDDGRVRVTDFGLVAGVSDGAPRAAVSPEAPAPSLTHTGALLGTPRYMAPEQHAGSAVDARADQFAFCVALYEALFRQPPFRGETYAELVAAVQAGSLVPPPASEVPPAVRAAVIRGLSADRDDRFPTLDALLAVLAAAISPPARRRSWTTIALAIAAVVIAVVVVIAYELRRDASRADERADELEATVADMKLKEARSSPAGSSEPPASPLAMKHAQLEFEAGEAAYRAGQYVEASAAFQRAYSFRRFSAFLFNAGSSLLVLYRKGHDPAVGREAIVLLRRYLDAEPVAADRYAVAKSIAGIEASLAAR